MQEMIIASLLAVQKVMIQDKHAFEMYGYDIMVGGTAQPGGCHARMQTEGTRRIGGRPAQALAHRSELIAFPLR